MSESESKSTTERKRIKSTPGMPKLIRRATKPLQSTLRLVSIMPKLVRLLAWLPCVIATLGTAFVFSNMVSITAETLGAPTQPYPATSSAAVVPGEFSVTSTASPGNDIAPANLNIEIVSIDISSQTVSVKLSLALSSAIVSRLRLFEPSSSAPVPLTAVRQSTWASLLLGIYLTPCLSSFPTSEDCGLPVATVSLGNLITPDGRNPSVSGFSVPGTVTLPLLGWPNRFPSDVYELDIVAAPDIVRLPYSAVLSAKDGFAIPTTVTIAADAGLADHTLTAFEDSPSHPLVIGLRIGRPGFYQITIYIVALLPLLLGWVVVHTWLRRRQPIFDLGFIAGLIAALLAILPLRTVLIPSNFNGVGPTLIDEILLLGVLLIAVSLFFQYARIVVRRPKPRQRRSQATIPSTRKRRNHRSGKRPLQRD